MSAVRRQLLEFRRWTRRGHHEQQHPADGPPGRPIEHTLQQHVQGWLFSTPPSTAQWPVVMFPYGRIAGRTGTSPASGTSMSQGTNDGSNAPGNDAVLRAARASASATSERHRSSSVKVNRPRWLLSWTKVPRSSVNRLDSPVSRVVVM